MFMTRINPKCAAPMPKTEEDIRNNSMKLYAYLVTIAGLADYPSNTRMFRQKNLILTKIYDAIGITDKTVKLYLYYLEENGLVEYKGDNKFKYKNRNNYSSFSDYRKDVQSYSSEIWKLRKKDKESVYYIPRPTPYTPVPEITLKKLNEYFKITEIELKLYLFCCKYRDLCVERNMNYKAMTYEDIRDILGLKKDARIDRSIFLALTFLEKLGLVHFSIGYTANSKLAKIPVFKITDVAYYIGEKMVSFEDDEMLTANEKVELKEVNERIEIGYEKLKNQ